MTSAWAIGHHSQANAVESCSAREGADRRKCIRALVNTRPIEVTANCVLGTAWRIGEKERYQLSADALASKLAPLEEQAAWTLGESSRWRQRCAARTGRALRGPEGSRYVGHECQDAFDAVVVVHVGSHLPCLSSTIVATCGSPPSMPRATNSLQR
jgi:hypothetical protein